MFGAGPPFWGHALQIVWDKSALGTSPSKTLGQTRTRDTPFIFLLGQALGTCQITCQEDNFDSALTRLCLRSFILPFCFEVGANSDLRLIFPFFSR